jgi:hypothetical protein
MPPSPKINSLYRPDADGNIIVYAGDLTVERGGDTRNVAGRLELQLRPSPSFSAHVVGSDPWLIGVVLDPVASASLPALAPLEPPHDTTLPTRSEEPSWIDYSIPTKHLTSGDLARVECLLLHLVVALSDQDFPLVETEDGPQRQLDFALPGWNLKMAAVDAADSDDGFSSVVSATPTNLPIVDQDVERLQKDLFFALSFVVGHEVGIGALVGTDSDGAVAWAMWGAPRFRAERAALRWCPDHLAVQALTTITEGLERIGSDNALSASVKRSVEHWLVANGSEVLDVRIPVACSGLELLGWSILQRNGWLTASALGKLTAGSVCRLLLRWANIPDPIPNHFSALAARRKRLLDSDEAGPEVVFNIRNALMHPPRRVDEPEWPTSEELIEAWQLSTWYLELAILRLLDYRGHYLSRLRFGKFVRDTEPVPWVLEDEPTSGGSTPRSAD